MLTSNGYVLDERPHRMGALESVPEHERHDREALWRRMRRDGYLLLRGHLDPQLVSGFREYYFDRLRATGLVDPAAPPALGRDSGAEIDRGLMRSILFDDIVPGDTYGALTAHPSIRDWFAWFLDDEVHLHKRRIIRHIRPGEAGIGTATQAHYDLVYLREGTDRVLSIWIPLGDCPIELGGLCYLEGSHRWVMEDERNGILRRAEWMTADLPRLAEERDSRWLMADYRAGDVVVHSSHIVHAATDNVDAQGRIRLSTDIRYQRVSDPIDWRWQNDWFEGDGL